MFSVFVCTYRFTNQAVQVQVLDISVKFLFLYQMKFIYFNAYTRCFPVQFGSSENLAVLQQVILCLNTSKKKLASNKIFKMITYMQPLCLVSLLMKRIVWSTDCHILVTHLCSSCRGL